MDKNLHTIDQQFQDAFGGYEAPYSPTEMQADWSQVSAQLPQTPAAHPPVKAPVWGAGKVLTIAGAAAVATTAAVLIYNTLVNKPEVPEQSNKPVSEQLVQNPTVQPGDNTAAPANTTDPSKVEDKPLAGKSGYQTVPNKPEPPVNPGGSENNKGNGNSSTSTVHSSGDQTSGNSEVKTDPKNNPRQIEPQQNNTNKVLPAAREIYFSDTIICAGQEISVENLSAASLSDNISLEWGDGEKAIFGRTQRHVYRNPGNYVVKVRHGDEIMKRVVTVETAPRITFTTKFEGLKCTFRNNSAGNLTWRWDFGDGTPVKTGYSPEHRYRDTGRYFVVLTGATRSGCMSTVTRMIHIRPTPDVPNVITPNGDGANDVVDLWIEDESYFDFVIYSRDSRLVFKSNDKNYKWDGRDMSGQVCQPGTYYYVLQYKYRGDNEMRQLRGTVSITE